MEVRSGAGIVPARVENAGGGTGAEAAPHLMSSSLAKMMMARALGVSRSLLMTLSNSPDLGSRGILMD